MLEDSPERALRRYAVVYINWSAAQLTARERELADLSIGAARLTAQQTAAGTGLVSQLTEDHVSNRGDVVAISRAEGQAGGDWVVVTSEHTSGAGPYAGLPAGFHVTLARVTHLRAGWAVSSWRPTM
jgi:hypothetical protein